MYHIAQANYSQWKPDISQELMKDFLEQADYVHDLAENSEGYVWRYEYDPHNHTLDKLFGVARVIFNMTVWETIDDLKVFAFKNLHGDVMQRREDWFISISVKRSVLWWIQDQHTPTADEAKIRLDMLNELGPTAEAFTFGKLFPSPA